MTRLFEGHGWTIDLETADLPDGRTSERSRAAYADTVHLLAFDERGDILMLREYRPFYNTYIWMLPSGHVDKEKDPLVAAKRELQEETGYRAENVSFLWKANSTEKLKDTNHFYRAGTLTKDPLPQDDDELMEVHPMTIDEAIEKVLTSPVVHMASAYGLMRYLKEKKVV